MSLNAAWITGQTHLAGHGYSPPHPAHALLCLHLSLAVGTKNDLAPDAMKL